MDPCSVMEFRVHSHVNPTFLLPTHTSPHPKINLWSDFPVRSVFGLPPLLHSLFYTLA